MRVCDTQNVTTWVCCCRFPISFTCGLFVAATGYNRDRLVCTMEYIETELRDGESHDNVGYFYLIHMGATNSLEDFSVEVCRCFVSGRCYDFLSETFENIQSDLAEDGIEIPVDLVVWDSKSRDPNKMGVLVGPWSPNARETVKLWIKFESYSFPAGMLLTHSIIPEDPIAAERIRVESGGDQGVNYLMKEAYRAIDAKMNRDLESNKISRNVRMNISTFERDDNEE